MEYPIFASTMSGRAFTTQIENKAMYRNKGTLFLFPAHHSVTSSLHVFSWFDRWYWHRESHHIFSSCFVVLSTTKNHSLETHHVYQYRKFTLLLLPAPILCYSWLISMSLNLINFIRVSLGVSFKASARPCKKLC